MWKTGKHTFEFWWVRRLCRGGNDSIVVSLLHRETVFCNMLDNDWNISDEFTSEKTRNSVFLCEISFCSTLALLNFFFFSSFPIMKSMWTYRSSHLMYACIKVILIANEIRQVLNIFREEKDDDSIDNCITNLYLDYILLILLQKGKIVVLRENNVLTIDLEHFFVPRGACHRWIHKSCFHHRFFIIIFTLFNEMICIDH